MDFLAPVGEYKTVCPSCWGGVLRFSLLLGREILCSARRWRLNRASQPAAAAAACGCFRGVRIAGISVHCGVPRRPRLPARPRRRSPCLGGQYAPIIGEGLWLQRTLLFFSGLFHAYGNFECVPPVGEGLCESQLRPRRRRRRERRTIVVSSSNASVEADNERELAALACMAEMRYRIAQRAARAARRRMRARRQQRAAEAAQRQLLVVWSRVVGRGAAGALWVEGIIGHIIT